MIDVLTEDEEISFERNEGNFCSFNLASVYQESKSLLPKDIIPHSKLRMHSSLNLSMYLFDICCDMLSSLNQLFLLLLIIKLSVQCSSKH